ncbi:MAG: dockerin type I repeat-containing protein [Ruminococcus sp.]|nr:dockerin type I repeat-containing protein [Ruminococcus sp.]
MKKLLSTLLSISVIAGALPMGAVAKSDPIFIESGADHWESTHICGDVNEDGEISVADVVILQKYIMGKDDYDDDGNVDRYTLDVNLDGYFDSFDLVQMRRLVINPEQAEKHTYAVDVLNTEADIPTIEEKELIWSENLDKVITEYDEMSEYLKTFITDNDELQKYLEKYDETFFEENNLILAPYLQERGNGVLTMAGEPMRLNNVNIYDKTVENFIFFVIGGNYAEDAGLYPVTNAKMLAQITVPKSQTTAEDNVLYLNLQSDSFFSDRYETASYTDGTHEIVITQENGWGIGANVYIKNEDGSFTYVGHLNPEHFFEDGELSTENYTITFCDEGFIIDYTEERGERYKLQSSYDGERVTVFNPYSTVVYKSSDGETELYFKYRYLFNPNGGDILDETVINMYIRQPDGYLKHFGSPTADGNNMPFKEEGEWSTDSDGNNVFSGDTYSITWLDNSIIVDYQSGNWWKTGEIDFESGSAEFKYYRK